MDNRVVVEVEDMAVVTVAVDMMVVMELVDNRVGVVVDMKVVMGAANKEEAGVDKLNLLVDNTVVDIQDIVDSFYFS